MTNSHDKIYGARLQHLFDDREVIDTFIEMNGASPQTIQESRKRSYEVSLANGYYADALRRKNPVERAIMSRVRRLRLTWALWSYVRKYRRYMQSDA